MQLRVPDSAVVLLVGVAGSGKSTFAARWWRPTEIVSSDACRALVADDPADQAASADAFAVLHLIVAARLGRGRMTVVDATHVTSAARRTPLALARAAGAPPVAVVLDFSLDVCLERNAGRDRRVEEDVIRRQHADLQASLPVLAAEGFTAVYVLRAPRQADAATVVREAR